VHPIPNCAAAGGSCLSGPRPLPNGGSDKQSPPGEVVLSRETRPEIPPPLEGPACQDRAFCRMAALTSRALQKRSLCLGSPRNPASAGGSCLSGPRPLPNGGSDKQRPPEEVPPHGQPPRNPASAEGSCLSGPCLLPNGGSDKQSPPEEVPLHGQPPRNSASAGGSCLSGPRLLPI